MDSNLPSLWVTLSLVLTFVMVVLAILSQQECLVMVVEPMQLIEFVCDILKFLLQVGALAAHILGTNFFTVNEC